MDSDDMDFLLCAVNLFDNLGRQAFDHRSLCVRARYMNTVSDEHIPSEIFTSDDAWQAMELSHQIFDFCDSLVGWY